MHPQPTQERRQYPRRDASLTVSYQRGDGTAGYGIAQTRTVSLGGVLLTTAKAFAAGTRLAIRIRLPFRGVPRLVEEAAEVVESREFVRSFLYETRVRFVDLVDQSSQILGNFCAGRPIRSRPAVVKGNGAAPPLDTV